MSIAQEAIFYKFKESYTDEACKRCLANIEGSFYNAKTQDKLGLVIPVKITIYDDRSYSFILKSPPASVLLAKFANASKGAAQPNRQNVGTVTLEQVKEIAMTKMADLKFSYSEVKNKINAAKTYNQIKKDIRKLSEKKD